MNDSDFAQRILLNALLEAHPSMLEVVEVRRRLRDLPELDEALEALASDGLVSRLGEMIGATRAAVRGAQLAA